MVVLAGIFTSGRKGRVCDAELYREFSFVAGGVIAGVGDMKRTQRWAAPKQVRAPLGGSAVHEMTSVGAR